MPSHQQKTNSSQPYGIMVVDDHPIIRQGLAQLINQEEDLFLCGEAGSAQEGIQEVEKQNPALVIVDISLQGTNGIEFIKEMKIRFPRIPTLVISMHDESIYAERALRAGAKGYLMKQEATEKVVSAIRKVLNGELYVSHRMAEGLLHKFIEGQPISASPLEGLTDRELEVFQLVGQGKTTKQIAEELHLSVKTIESHYAKIKEKLNLRNSTELTQTAIKWFHLESL